MTLPDRNQTSEIDPTQRSAFRSSWSQPEGVVGALIMEGKVVDVNLKLWTVDVISQHDQKWWLNIQIGSPYMHSNNGEGIYIMPDIGAKCHVCVPSDGPPPFVMDFIMPQETIPQAGTAEEPEGRDGGTSDATFAGGRVRPKSGDIYIRGRDGNFCILHRGGVLQIGCTELAQRIYIPLQNLITDISQNYRHYNSGGSLNWFLAPGESETNPATLHRETYRLLAGDEKATLRITRGLLKDFMTEPDGGAQSDIDQLGMANDDNPIVWEVVIAPESFGADTGSLEENAAKNTKLRYFFDKAGNAFMRSEGSVLLFVRKKLRLVAKDSISISTTKDFSIAAKTKGRIDGGSLLELTAKVTKINGGSKPVAHVGSVVEMTMILPLTGLPAAPGAPVVIPPVDPITGMPVKFKGTIVSGNSTVLV